MPFDISGGFRCILADQIIASITRIQVFFDKVFCLLFREKCIKTISLYGMSTNRVKIKKGIYG